MSWSSLVYASSMPLRDVVAPLALAALGALATLGALGALGACSTRDHASPPGDASVDAAADAVVDASTGCFSASGAPGQCIVAAACTAMSDHSTATGNCAMAAPIACCIDTPDVADNPPTPTGYKLMTQAQVTPAMTTWAVSILHDPVTYRMFSTTTRTFGTQLVLARVEWHPPDFQNSIVHRGVTLYVPT